MSKKLVLIDGHSILNRAYYGIPLLSNAQGLHTNAIYGFLNIMFKILEEEKPDYLAVAFDVHAPTFRHEIYEAYKGTRKPMPEELREQVPVMKEVLQAMHVVIREQAGLEADDILGTLAKKAEADGMEVALVSGDRDLLQIATDHIKIRIPKTKMGKTEIEDYYAADVKAAYQVTPLQFIDLKALMGDTADNIPGVPKVGQKTAEALMVEYGSLDNIYAHIEEITKKSIRESLENNKDLAELSRVLATIKTDCEISLDYEAARAEGYYTPEAYQLFKQLEFKNLLSRFERPQVDETGSVSKRYVRIETAKEMAALLQKYSKQKERVGISLCGTKESLYALAIAPGCGSENEEEIFYYAAQSGAGESALGQVEETEEGQLSFCFEEEKTPVKTVGSVEEPVLKALAELSKKVPLAAFDIKKEYPFLDQEKPEKNFDILIGAYLLDPLKNDYDLETIASKHLELTIPGQSELFGKLSLEEAFLQEEKKEEALSFLCSSAFICRRAAAVLERKLQESGMDHLMQDIEMPLSLVLYDME